MSRTSSRTAILGVGLLVAASFPVAAQTNIETNAPGIQLNFSVPGARSLALGGSFLGRADDATAAYANPAGLANLPQQEASLEMRGWDYTHLFTDSGRNGVPSGIGADTIEGLVDGEASDQVTGVSFASYVYPKRRWAAAVYFHSLADFKANFATRGAFVGEVDDGLRLFPVTSTSRLEITNIGVSASYRLTEDLSLGVGVSRYDLSIDSRLERVRFPGNSFGELGVDATELINSQTQRGEDSDVGLTLGLLWRLNSDWQVGGVFRQGPSFAFEARHQVENRPRPPVINEAAFHVPDIWGVGIMWQTTERLIAGLDVYRIGYSSFAEDFVDVFVTGEGAAGDFSANDGTELHLGLEYLFPDGIRPWFLRAGTWWDPEHGARYSGAGEDALGMLYEVVFRPRGGLWHLAAGGGVVGHFFQVDAGVDYSKRTLTVSVSTVVRF